MTSGEKTDLLADRMNVGSIWKERVYGSKEPREVEVVDVDKVRGTLIAENRKTGLRARFSIKTILAWEPVFSVVFDPRFLCPSCGRCAEPFGGEPVIWSPEHKAFFHVHRSILKLESKFNLPPTQHTRR